MGSRKMRIKQVEQKAKREKRQARRQDWNQYETFYLSCMVVGVGGFAYLISHTMGL